MPDSVPARPRHILVVEDEDLMQEQLARLLKRYGDQLVVTLVRDAGQALDTLARRDPPVDALVLDLMMPYGAAREVLAAGDSSELDTGLHVLEHVRKAASLGSPPLWVAVITARSGLAIGRRVRELLGDRGRLYLKPFDTLRFEHELLQAVGLRSLVADLFEEGKV